MTPVSGVGHKVRQLRLEAGLSQDDIARVLRISVPMVSRLENDKRQLSALELRLLHDAFGWDPRTLLALPVERTIGSLPGLVHELADRFDCDGLRHAAVLLELDALLDMLGCPNPAARTHWYQPDRGPQTAVRAVDAGHSVAKTMRVALELDDHIDIDALLERLGIDVLVTSLTTEELVIAYDSRSALVTVSSAGGEHAVRYRLARALGHLVFTQPDACGVISSLSPLYEHQRAQAFATELLMPRAAVELTLVDAPWVATQQVADELAAHLQVSPQAVVHRLEHFMRAPKTPIGAPNRQSAESRLPRRIAVRANQALEHGHIGPVFHALAQPPI